MTLQRRGFTLVELLVVAGILAVLFALVVGSSGQRPTAIRAAQELASMLLSAQSRALGRTEGAAVIIEPDASVPRNGAVVHDGTMLPPIIIAAPAGVLGAHPDLANGYKVRFRQKVGAVSPTSFITISPWLALQAGVPVRRESAGQTVANTIIKPVGAAIEALVVRYPTMGAKASKLSTAIAVDLRHSGVGEDPAAAHGHGRFENQGPIAVIFDQTGRVAEVIMRVGTPGGTEPIVPNEIIYFYFAERKDINASQSLGSDRSAWVAINPQTGRINVSANVQSAETGLVAARDKARKAIALGK